MTMPSAWLLSLVSLARGRIRRSQKTITYTYTPASSRKLKRISSRSRSSSTSSGSPPDQEVSRTVSKSLSNEIRPGLVIVYVGIERRRFIVPSSILNHSLFRLLLEKFGSSHGPECSLDDEPGAILLPCNTEFLHRLLFLMDSGADVNQEMRWEELKKLLEDSSAGRR